MNSVKVVSQWGSDEAIVERARMSTGKGFQGWEKDLKFLRRLWEKGHTSPFEMAGFAVEVEAPIFVARQWMRHRTQSYNEQSLRYIEHQQDYFFSPEIWRAQAEKNKQSSSGPIEEQEFAKEIYSIALESAESSYRKLLSLGVSREQARMVLPVSTMTRFTAQALLLNWIKFINLRDHEDAQEEIRDLAKEVKQVVKYYFPRTYEVVYG